jgi:gamma-glutamyltranspeptidase/glutathione hydrolase
MPLEVLLGTEYLCKLADASAPGWVAKPVMGATGSTHQAGGAVGPHGTAPDPADGDTIACVAADSDGWAVSIIQSVYHGFGSAILEPSTGIVAHDRGACFSLDPASPNLLEGGKRPLHTLMPVMVRWEGRLAIVAGTMGGEAQPQIHAQILCRLLGHAGPTDRDSTLAGPDAATDGAVAAAVASPRWIWDEGVLFVEADVPDACLDALRATGMPLELLDPVDESVGHAQYIRIDPDGTLEAGTDPRADGAAFAGSA